MQTTEQNVTRGETNGLPTMITSSMYHQRKARMGEQEAEGSHPSKIAHPLTCTLGLSQFSDSDQPTEEVVCFLLLFFRRREPTPPWQIHTVMTPTVPPQRDLQPLPGELCTEGRRIVKHLEDCWTQI